MSQSSVAVGEKTRSRVGERASQSIERQTGERRKIPASYLARHPCKVCDGKHCTGHCKF
jgi:hypothetical protein